MRRTRQSTRTDTTSPGEPGWPIDPAPPHVDRRPLVARTIGSTTDGIYGLVLALSVIAVSWYSGPPDAGRVGMSVLLTAVVFWLAHVYAYALGRDMSRDQRATRAEIADALRENWSIIEVAIPLVLVLGLGAVDAIPDTAAILAATAIASTEIAAAAGYAASRHGAGRCQIVASAAVGLALGLVVVLLKAVAFAH